MHKTSLLLTLAALLPACLEPNRVNLPTGEDGSTSGTSDASTGNVASESGDAPPPDSDDTEDDPGSDDTGSSGAAESSGEDATTAPACDGRCVGIPDGWQGPVVAHAWGIDDPPIACEGSFDETLGEYSVGFAAQPAECGCDCGGVLGASCTQPTMRYNLSSCSVTVGSFLDLDPGCNDIADITDGYFTLRASEFSGNSCTSQPSVVIPEAGFAGDVVLCGTTPDPTGCADGELCGPGAGAPMCIWAEGEQSCPDGFENRDLLYSGFTDTRACTTCTCGEPEGTCDANHATLADNACGSAVTQLVQVQPGDCEPFDGTVESIVLPATPTPVGSCEPSDVSPTGEATPTIAATLCCAS